jgi:hypothetical protein
VVEGTPQHLQQVGAVGAGQVRDVGRVELSHRQHRNRSIWRDPRGPDAVDDRTLGRGQQVCVGIAGAAPRLRQDASPQPGIVQRYPPLHRRGVGVVGAGGPGLLCRPEQRAADGAVRHGRRAGSGMQPHGGACQRRQFWKVRGDVDRAGRSRAGHARRIDPAPDGTVQGRPGLTATSYAEVQLLVGPSLTCTNDRTLVAQAASCRAGRRWTWKTLRSLGAALLAPAIPPQPGTALRAALAILRGCQAAEADEVARQLQDLPRPARTSTVNTPERPLNAAVNKPLREPATAGARPDWRTVPPGPPQVRETGRAVLATITAPTQTAGPGCTWARGSWPGSRWSEPAASCRWM